MVRCRWRGHFSKPDELGSGAAIGPWEWFIFGKMAASSLRRVGLHEVVWGLGGRNARQVDGCRESEVSLREGFKGRDSPFDPWFGAGGEGRLQALRVIDRRYDLLALEWVQYPGRAKAGGMQRERAAGSLAKMRCTTPHILRVRDKEKSGDRGVNQHTRVCGLQPDEPAYAALSTESRRRPLWSVLSDTWNREAVCCHVAPS